MSPRAAGPRTRIQISLGSFARPNDRIKGEESRKQSSSWSASTVGVTLAAIPMQGDTHKNKQNKTPGEVTYRKEGRVSSHYD